MTALQRACEGVFVSVFEARSTIAGAVDAGNGLFNGSHRLEKGDAILLYGSRHVKLSMDPASYRGGNLNQYNVMEFDDYRIWPVSTLSMCYRVNEPPQNTCANAAFVRWLDPRQSMPSYQRSKGAKHADIVCLHAAREIDPYEEIFAHYGRAYAREYTAGTAATLRKSDVRPDQWPGIVAEKMRICVPSTCVRIAR